MWACFHGGSSLQAARRRLSSINSAYAFSGSAVVCPCLSLCPAVVVRGRRGLLRRALVLERVGKMMVLRSFGEDSRTLLFGGRLKKLAGSYSRPVRFGVGLSATSIGGLWVDSRRRNLLPCIKWCRPRCLCGWLWLEAKFSAATAALAMAEDLMAFLPSFLGSVVQMSRTVFQSS